MDKPSDVDSICQALDYWDSLDAWTPGSWATLQVPKILRTIASIGADLAEVSFHVKKWASLWRCNQCLSHAPSKSLAKCCNLGHGWGTGRSSQSSEALWKARWGKQWPDLARCQIIINYLVYFHLFSTTMLPSLSHIWELESPTQEMKLKAAAWMEATRLDMLRSFTKRLWWMKFMVAQTPIQFIKNPYLCRFHVNVFWKALNPSPCHLIWKALCVSCFRCLFVLLA